MLPIKGKCYVTQGYGLTDYAKSKGGKAAYKNFPGGIHPGVDFGTNGITLECVSLCDGKVVAVSKNVDGWGNHVEIEGPDGWRRQYAHLSAISVQVGQEVRFGGIIGRVGTTGASTGIHLHYGNRRKKLIGWEYRDPTPDFEDKKIPVPKRIKSRLIKGNGTSLPNIYVYNGKTKHKIPDIQTLHFLFGQENYELVENDVLTKIPEGEPIPSLQ